MRCTDTAISNTFFVQVVYCCTLYGFTSLVRLALIKPRPDLHVLLKQASPSAGMEPNVADQAQESNSATAPQTPGKGTRTSSFRNLLRPLSPRSVDSLAPSDSRAPDLYATVRPSSPPSLETEEGEKKGLCNIDHPVAESWLRKAYSITSPRPTDQDDLPVLDVPSTSGEGRL